MKQKSPVKPPKGDNTEKANAVIKSKHCTQQNLHWATMAKTTNTKQKPQHHTEISQWLIDSGCSNHMTPHPEDLIMDISSTKSLVEVANGNIVKAPKKGTAKIKITDIKTNNTYSILLEDVLLVPGASSVLPSDANTATNVTKSISLNIPLLARQWTP